MRWLLCTSTRSPQSQGHRVGAHTELWSCPRGRWWPCQARWWPVPAPRGLRSIARGLLRPSKIISPGLNCITRRTGNIPWGCAAYFISVLRAGACDPLGPAVRGWALQPRHSSPGSSLRRRTRVRLPEPALARPAASRSPFPEQRSGCSRASHLQPQFRRVPVSFYINTSWKSALLLCFRISPEERCTFSDIPLRGHVPLPPTSQRSSPRARHSRALASSPFQPRPRSTSRNSLCGTRTEDETAVSWSAPRTPNWEANPHRLLPHTPHLSSHSFCCPSSSARADRALRGLTPALAAPQPSGKHHMDARCSLRL